MIGKHQLRFFLISVYLAFLVALTGNHIAEAAAGDVAALSTVMPSASSLPRCDPLTDFSPTNFAYPTKIDNPFYPLVPGTQLILDGTINVGGTSTGHRVVFTVTDLVKVINGVKTRVLWDLDINDGEIAESELAFQAQDNGGNVWVLGEYPEEYEDGEFAGAPSTWIGGVRDARPGVLVPGYLQLGTPPFRQGYSPSIGFYDCGQVFALNQIISGYRNVSVINEWDPRDSSGGIQQKYYAEGLGLIRIGALNDPEAEVMTLTRVRHLNAHALADAREEALKLEKRAYTISDVYAQTLPMELEP